MLDKSLAVIYSLMILGQAAALRAYIGTWIAPACLWGLFWFMFTFVPLVALWNVPVNPDAVLYLLVASCLFSLTALPFSWRRVFRLRRENPMTVDYGSAFMLNAFYVISLVAIFSLLIDLWIQGVTIWDAIFSPMQVAARMIDMRYSESLVPNIFSKLSFATQYPAAIIGGFIYVTRPAGAKRARILVLTFLPSILGMILLGAKGTLFQAFAFYWGGTLVCKIQRGDLRILSREEIRKLLPYGALVVGLVTVSLLSRFIGNAGADILEGLQRLFASYVTAHLYGFSDWFSFTTDASFTQYYFDLHNSSALYTFTPIARLLGDTTALPPGTYDEYFTYDALFQTNIYTMFRGLIIDFGMWGSLLFMVLFGVAMHLSYWMFLVARYPAMSASIFIHSVGYFYSSFMISLLTYNSIYLSVVIIAIVLFMNRIASLQLQRAKLGVGSLT
ncbi:MULTISPECIES: O-antigen polymerase [unclassified Cupriavidus]|uniref:O-antigen polymerase n=1 Tax=unclassified Cupriavidus TaxID=2640874 RepID=UPI0010F9F35A|nr:MULTISPECIES: O-antigen polymerase [unclassified Cupriavidus]MWL87983.1 oligosaccharide repeat unit polymerase [Cupriavidus sp. SW-Y-13]